VKDEAPARLDRPAVEDGAVGGLAGIEAELLQERAEADAGALVANADADGAIFIMDGKRDDGMVETRVGHAGHGQQQAAGKERRLLHLEEQNAPLVKREQATSTSSAQA